MVSHSAAGALVCLGGGGARGRGPVVRERRQPLWAYVDSRPLSQTGPRR
ncbi:MAG: hypothetical protein R2910_03665 [Gemmatimonadales bacterium]